MRILGGNSFDEKEADVFLRQQVRTKGLLRKEPLEEAVVFSPILRPFRKVRWSLAEHGKDCCSLIDEDLSHISLPQDQHLLLWRPRYAKLEWIDYEESSLQFIKSSADDSTIQSLVDDLIARRRVAKDDLDESEDEIRRTQADKRAALAFVIPRLPGSVRKQEALEKERRPSQGILMAASLVMNCPQDESVVRGELGQRIWVRTMMAEFRSAEDESSRLVFLEMPESASLQDSLSYGRPLTRLCDLNESARTRVHRQFTTLVSTNP